MFEALSQDEVDRLFGPKKIEIDKDSGTKVLEDVGIQLSQDEIDKLVMSGSSVKLTPKDELKLKIHDFKKVNILTKNELIGFKILAEQFAKDLSEYFSGKTNRSIIFSVADVSQMTREEFGFRIPRPTFFATASFFGKPILIQSDVGVVQHGILERHTASKQILEFDEELYKFTVVKPLLACLFKRVSIIKEERHLSFSPSPLLEPVACKADTCDIVPLYEMGCNFAIRVRCDNEEGMFNIFNSKAVTSAILNRGIVTKDETVQLKDRKTKTDCIVSIGGAWSKDAQDLKSGVVLPLDKRSGDGVDLIKDGHVIAKGNIVVMDTGFYGISITRVIKN